MSFTKTKINYINDVDVFNAHLYRCKNLIRISEDQFKMLDKSDKKYTSQKYYNLKDAITTITLSYTPKGERYQHFVFKLDGGVVDGHKTGMESFALLQKMSDFKTPDLTENKELYDDSKQQWKILSISGLVWYNPKFKNKRTENCFGYDLNSSYPWAMTQIMPDTRVKPKKFVKLQAGEIGFNQCVKGFSDTPYLYMETNPGVLCEFVFPAIESPYKHFVEYYYDKKQKAKNKAERTKYKDILNFSVGYIRRVNPFVHSAILSHAKYNIEKYINTKYIIYCNTDSLVSTKELNLELGENLGQFKLEHNDSFAYNKSGYQWGFKVPSIKGKSKQWFKNKYPNGFDILKDELPYIESNIYMFDEEQFKIKKVKIKGER